MTLVTDTLLRFLDSIDGLNSPTEILDFLHVCAATAFRVQVYGAWRWALRPGESTGYATGYNVFLHSSAPEGYQDAHIAAWAVHGPSALARMAWQNRGPFTFAECMHVYRPIGDDRWVFDLLQEYGIRDGLYCPLGVWSVLYWSSRVLKLPSAHRALLYQMALLASLRMEKVVSGRRKGKAVRLPRRTTLTARELAVLQRIADGFETEEIARDLKISHPTVRTFLQRAIRKLKAKNRVHAVAEAIRGLLMR